MFHRHPTAANIGSLCERESTCLTGTPDWLGAPLLLPGTDRPNVLGDFYLGDERSCSHSPTLRFNLQRFIDVLVCVCLSFVCVPPVCVCCECVRCLLNFHLDGSCSVLLLTGAPSEWDVAVSRDDLYTCEINHFPQPNSTSVGKKEKCIFILRYSSFLSLSVLWFFSISHAQSLYLFRSLSLLFSPLTPSLSLFSSPLNSCHFALSIILLSLVRNQK